MVVLCGKCERALILLLATIAGEAPARYSEEEETDTY